MSRARTRRPGSRGNRRAPSLADVPDDLPSAALAALDELLTGSAGRVDDAKGGPAAVPSGPAQRRTPPPPPGVRKPSRRPATPAVEDERVIREVAEVAVPMLRCAVLEEDSYLAPAQGGIAAAGHAVAIAGAGPEGAARVVEMIQRGDVDVVIVALPATGTAIAATSIFEAAFALEPRRPIVIAALSGDGASAVRRATVSGCDLVCVRPHDVDRIAPVLLAAARLHAAQSATVRARGSEQVLRAKLEEIADPDPRGLQPFELFQRVLELEIRRARRYAYSLAVALFAVEVPAPAPPGILGILRARAGNALIHTIRDIDLATQLDHERFLVLLPYTDLTGAAGLARRVIAAVGDGDPVVSGGRAYPPRVVGAVAGAMPGQPISFAKLMKDATRALEQARRDGAELAVQP
jgi:hypothetical protein